MLYIAISYEQHVYMVSVSLSVVLLHAHNEHIANKGYLQMNRPRSSLTVTDLLMSELLVHKCHQLQAEGVGMGWDGACDEV